MQTFTKLVGIFTKFIFLVVCSAYLFYFVYKSYLFLDISSVVKKEAEKIQLPDEITSAREINKYSGCHFDYKVGGLRCDSSYDKYYSTNNDPVEEFNKIYSYLNSLGWYCQYPSGNTTGSYEQLKSKGIMPSCRFDKDSKYYLRIYLHFLGERDKSTAESLYGREINDKLNEYNPETQSLYRIRVTADLKG